MAGVWEKWEILQIAYARCVAAQTYLSTGLLEIHTCNAINVENVLNRRKNE